MEQKEKPVKPIIKQWPLNPDVEKDLFKLKEKFKVLRPCRINLGDGEGAKPYKRGDEVEIIGEAKKDLYFQNKIVYPEDFAKIDEYETAINARGGYYNQNGALAESIPNFSPAEFEKQLKKNKKLEEDLQVAKNALLDINARLEKLEGTGEPAEPEEAPKQTGKNKN